MAWNECHIQAKTTVTKKMVSDGCTLKDALKQASKESGIPVSTLKKWYYAGESKKKEHRKNKKGNKNNDLPKGSKTGTYSEHAEIIDKKPKPKPKPKPKQPSEEFRRKFFEEADKDDPEELREAAINLLQLKHWCNLSYYEPWPKDLVQLLKRKIVMENHPDKGGNTTQFIKLKEALDAL